MNSLQNLKAGPSEAQHRWRGETSKSQRLFNALTIVIVVSLGCFAFVQLFLVQQKQTWFWRQAGDQNSKEWYHESSKRTQYLLGVGKADITGYWLLKLFFLRLRANFLSALLSRLIWWDMQIRSNLDLDFGSDYIPELSLSETSNILKTDSSI